MKAAHGFGSPLQTQSLLFVNPLNSSFISYRIINVVLTSRNHSVGTAHLKNISIPIKGCEKLSTVSDELKSTVLGVSICNFSACYHTWKTMTKASRTASTVQNSLEISYGVLDQGGSL